MASRIGEAIKQGHAVSCSPKNKVCSVILRIIAVVTEEAVIGVIGIVWAKCFEIFNAPRSPNIFVLHYRYSDE